jgi:hypothetical protein
MTIKARVSLKTMFEDGLDTKSAISISWFLGKSWFKKKFPRSFDHFEQMKIWQFVPV